MRNNTAAVLTVIGFEMAQGFPQAVCEEKCYPNENIGMFLWQIL